MRSSSLRSSLVDSNYFEIFSKFWFIRIECCDVHLTAHHRFQTCRPWMCAETSFHIAWTHDSKNILLINTSTKFFFAAVARPPQCSPIISHSDVCLEKSEWNEWNENQNNKTNDRSEWKPIQTKISTAIALVTTKWIKYIHEII